MKIKEIKIKNIGPHENTEINLGSKATIIFAENGTGKSLFANSFSKKNKWWRGWNQESQIVLKGDGNSKGKLIFAKENVEWQDKLSISNDVILYDDWIFNETLKNHYKNQVFLPSDNEQTKKTTLRWWLHDIREIIKLSNMTKILDEAPNESILPFKMNRYSSSPSDITAKQIVQIYNTKTNFEHGIHALSSRERLALEMYFNYRNREDEWASIEILESLLFLKYKIRKSLALFKENRNSKIPVKDIPIIKNILTWIDIFKSILKSSKMKLLFLNYEIHDVNFEKQNNDNLLERIKNKILREIRDFDSKIEKDKENRKNISIEMNKIIKTLPMHNKVTMDDNLKPISEKGEISLSSGEIKILDIIYFVERNKNQEKIFLFDDPLTSADTNYIRIILTYLKKALQDRQMIFLTHNEIVLNELRYGYRNQINSKSKKDNKKILFYIWKINKSSKVHSSKLPIHISGIEHAWRELNNEKNDSSLRIHYGRKIFEHMSFVAVGHNTFASIYDYENEEITWFGKKVKCPLELWRDLNKYSHYNLYDWSHIRNDSYLEQQINKLISIIKEIGFDLKENSKPYTSEIGFNSKIS